MLKKKVNTETSADSSGATCDAMVCLFVSSISSADFELGWTRPIYRCLYSKVASVSLQLWMALIET